MKTLSDLNTKWWYRLLKVLYCALFLVIGAISAVVAYDNNKTYLVPDLQVTCLYGNHSTFDASRDKDISIANYNPNKAIPGDLNASIQVACGITQADITAAQTQAFIETMNMRLKNGCAPGEAGLLCSVSISPATYNIMQIQVPVNTYDKALGYTVLDLIVVLALFEIIRRAFYYIVTGKIRPPK